MVAPEYIHIHMLVRRVDNPISFHLCIKTMPIGNVIEVADISNPVSVSKFHPQ
jgi:hypothetical protein